MKTNIARLSLLSSALVITVFCLGCSTQYKLKLKPVTSFPKSEPINMKVGLLLENEFAGQGEILWQRNAGIRKYDFRAPAAPLAQSAEALARAVFREVQVVNSLSAVNSVPPTCNAVLKPHFIKGEDVASGLAGGVILYLEWTLTKPTGELVWKKAFRGESVGGASANTQSQRAVEAAFANSYTNIYDAPVIRALAQ